MIIENEFGTKAKVHFDDEGHIIGFTKIEEGK